MLPPLHGIIVVYDVCIQAQGANTSVKMEVLVDRQNEPRERVQKQLNEIDKPLSTIPIMAMDLGGTVLATELRTALTDQESFVLQP